MARLTRTVTVDRAGLDRLRTARRDIVTEEADGDDAWTMVDGPFRRYHRTLSVLEQQVLEQQVLEERITEQELPERPVEPRNGTTDTPTERYTVVETTEYKLALPVWWPYLWLPMRFALAAEDRTPRRRWWWPKDVVPASISQLICYLGTIGMMAGYMGTLIGQTISFASSDFGIDDDVQANTLAAVRVGVLLSFVLLGRADRTGRKPLTIRFAFAAIL